MSTSGSRPSEDNEAASKHSALLKCMCCCVADTRQWSTGTIPFYTCKLTTEMHSSYYQCADLDRGGCCVSSAISNNRVAQDGKRLNRLAIVIRIRADFTAHTYLFRLYFRCEFAMERSRKKVIQLCFDCSKVSVHKKYFSSPIGLFLKRMHLTYVHMFDYKDSYVR